MEQHQHSHVDNPNREDDMTGDGMVVPDEAESSASSSEMANANIEELDLNPADLEQIALIYD